MRDYTYELGRFGLDAIENRVTEGSLTIHYKKSLPVWKLVKMLDLVASGRQYKKLPNIEWSDSGIVVQADIPLAITLTNELYDLRSSWKSDCGLEVSFLPTMYGENAPMALSMAGEVILMNRRDEHEGCA